jgi:hypothetical protein
MSYFKGIKVGNYVWDVTYGWGMVLELDHVIKVHFPDDIKRTEYYTYQGKFNNCKKGNQSLFWDEIKFEIPKKPVPKLKIDDKVLVRDSVHTKWYKRYFHSFSDGRIFTFDNGATSWSNDDCVPTGWSMWKLPDEDLNLNMPIDMDNITLC